MTLTARLYRLDEVQAAFLYSLKQRRNRDAHVWLNELEESGYPSEARSLLLVGWILRVGLARVSWLGNWSEASTHPQGRRQLCTLLNTLSERDTSIWWMLWYAIAQEEPPKQTLEQAVRTKNLCAGWWWMSLLDESTFWTTLRSFSVNPLYEPWLDSLQHGLGDHALFGRAVAYMLVYGTAHLSPLSLAALKPVDSREERDTYDQLLLLSSAPLRKQRFLSIPWECLFAMTRRGCGHETESELLSELGTAFREGGVWQRRLLSFQTADGSWKDDECIERFYEQYFFYRDGSGDIPDEWSKADREKSHGPAIRNCQDAVYSRWWRNWVYPERIFPFKEESAVVLKWLGEYVVNLELSLLDTMNALYEERKESGDV